MLRKNKLPKPRLQLAMIAMFVVVGALGLIVNFSLSIAELAKQFGNDPESRILLEQAQSGLLTQLWISIALMVPVLATVGMFVTFRVAGPLVALERYLDRLAAGETPGACQFRKGDELEELAEVATRVGERLRSLQPADPSAHTPTLQIKAEEELTR